MQFSIIAVLERCVCWDHLGIGKVVRVGVLVAEFEWLLRE